MSKEIQINVEYQDQLYKLKVDVSTEISDLLANLVRELDLPIHDVKRNLISYGLFLDGNDHALNEAETVADIGLKNRDFIILKPLNERSTVPSGSRGSESVPPVFSSEIEALTVMNHNLILNTRAQNRTTHAIRALVRLIFLQIIAAFCGGGLWAIANGSVDSYECQQSGQYCEPIAGLQVLAAIVYLGISIYGFIQSWKELVASEIE